MRACHWVLLTFLKVSLLHLALGDREAFLPEMFEYPEVRCFTVNFCFFSILENKPCIFNLQDSIQSISIVILP